MHPHRTQCQKWTVQMETIKWIMVNINKWFDSRDSKRAKKNANENKRSDIPKILTSPRRFEWLFRTNRSAVSFSDTFAEITNDESKLLFHNTLDASHISIVVVSCHWCCCAALPIYWVNCRFILLKLLLMKFHREHYSPIGLEFFFSSIKPIFLDCMAFFNYSPNEHNDKSDFLSLKFTHNIMTLTSIWFWRTKLKHMTQCFLVMCYVYRYCFKIKSCFDFGWDSFFTLVVIYLRKETASLWKLWYKWCRSIDLQSRIRLLLKLHLVLLDFLLLLLCL